MPHSRKASSSSLTKGGTSAPTASSVWAKSQALRYASIALSAPYRYVPSAAGPPTGACVQVRPAASGRRVEQIGCRQWVGCCRPSCTGERPVSARLRTLTKSRPSAPSWPNANSEGSLRATSSRSPRPGRPFNFSRRVVRDRPDHDRNGPCDIERPFRGGHVGQIYEGGSDACRKGYGECSHSTQS